MVEIVAQAQARSRTKGGSEVWIPPALLCTTDAGVQYLKVMGNHPSLCRIICASDMERWKAWKNPSLDILCWDEAAANIVLPFVSDYLARRGWWPWPEAGVAGFQHLARNAAAGCWLRGRGRAGADVWE